MNRHHCHNICHPRKLRGTSTNRYILGRLPAPCANLVTLYSNEELEVDYKLSARVRAIKPSPTIAVTNRAAELKAAGEDVIGLGAGEPDFDTPEFIKDAARKALADGMTKYTAPDGTPSLKDAIIEKFRRDNQLEFQRSNIVVSCGAKHTVYNLMQAIIDEGDEVIVAAVLGVVHRYGHTRGWVPCGHRHNNRRRLQNEARAARGRHHAELPAAGAE